MWNPGIKELNSVACVEEIVAIFFKKKYDLENSFLLVGFYVHHHFHLWPLSRLLRNIIDSMCCLYAFSFQGPDFPNTVIYINPSGP